MSTPNIACWPYRIHALKGGIPWKEGHHVRFFNPRRLRLYLFMNGFEIIASDHILVNSSRRFFVRWLINKAMKATTHLANNSRWQEQYDTLFAQGLMYLCRKDAEVPPVGVSEHRWPYHANKSSEYKRQIRQRAEQAFAIGLIDEINLKRILACLQG